MEETELDLRPVVRAIVRNWHLITFFAFVLAIIGGVIGILRGPTYEAQAEVAIVRLETQANFQSNIKQQADQVTPSTLRTGLVTIGQSGTVAADVSKALGTSLPPTLREPQALQSAVKVEAKGDTNVLQIHVTTTDQNVSKAVATAWGAAFVNRANTAFMQQNKGTDLSGELAQARANFETQQARLGAAPLEGDIARLQRQSTELNALIDSLHIARIHTITSTLTAQAKEQTTLLSLYGTAAVKGQTVPLNAARQSQIVELTSLYSTTARLRRLSEDVRALRDQVQKGSTSSTSVAYTLLKAQLFAGSEQLPANLQLQTTSNDVPTAADLDALLTNTTDRLKVIQEQINTLTTAFRQGTAYELPRPADAAEANYAFQQQLHDFVGQHDVASLLGSLVVTNTGVLVGDPVIDNLQSKYQGLVTQLEQKQGQLFVLTQERDLAKANYTALATRSTEIQAANAAADTVVRSAGDGVFTGVHSQTLRNIGLGFILGGTISTLFVILRFLVPTLLDDTAVSAVQGHARLSE